MNPDEWLDKADYEGGIYSALVYGMTEDSIDPDAHPEFRALVVEARTAFQTFQDVIDRFPSVYEVAE